MRSVTPSDIIRRRRARARQANARGARLTRVLAAGALLLALAVVFAPAAARLRALRWMPLVIRTGIRGCS